MVHRPMIYWKFAAAKKAKIVASEGHLMTTFDAVKLCEVMEKKYRKRGGPGEERVSIRRRKSIPRKRMIARESP